MSIRKETLIWLVIAGLFLPTAGLLSKQREVYIETAIKPGTKFEEAKLKSVAVLSFDGKDLQTLGGDPVNYMKLSKMLADDIIKKIYQLGKIEVALGQYEESVIETDTVDKKKGDLYLNSTSLERSVKFNCLPYKTVSAMLTGTINKYRQIGDGRGISFINVTIRLTDTLNGNVYWVTDIEGYYKDVVHTIAYTLSGSKYEEPVETVQQETDKTKSGKKDTKKKVEPVEPQQQPAGQ